MLEGLLQKRVALIDRQFVISEGRVVYPTAVGTLLAFDAETLQVQLLGDSTPSLFFRDAFRCVREAPEMPAAAEPAAAEPAKA